MSVTEFFRNQLYSDCMKCLSLNVYFEDDGRVLADWQGGRRGQEGHDVFHIEEKSGKVTRFNLKNWFNSFAWNFICLIMRHNPPIAACKVTFLVGSHKMLFGLHLPKLVHTCITLSGIIYFLLIWYELAIDGNKMIMLKVMIRNQFITFPLSLAARQEWHHWCMQQVKQVMRQWPSCSPKELHLNTWITRIGLR